MTLRIGHGYDAHRFSDGSRLVIGGVEIPFDKGLAAHSDGDVLIHAVCDALIGAIGYGDIGKHFPDTDPRYRGIDSRVLLREVIGLLREAGWRVNNVDATLVAERPKFKPHIEAMRENLAGDMNVALAQVNVKATTTEGMGFTGRAEGIAAHAVATIVAEG
jgi:2-C-methyl-D-erythritol 2,4-cyclodiphosphate synthase